MKVIHYSFQDSEKSSWVWCTPLFPAFGKRQADLYEVKAQAGLHNIIQSGRKGDKRGMEKERTHYAAVHFVLNYDSFFFKQ